MSRQYNSDGLDSPKRSRSIFNALLFPANLTGLGHIAIYTLCFALLNWVRSAMITHAGIAISFISLIITIEMFNYFSHCISESACGATAAPDSLLTDSFDTGSVSATLGGYFSLQAEYLSMLMPVLICFLPALLYPIFTEQFDHIFFILLGAGAFYFPMLLTAVIIFDSSSGYNPFIHIVSILCTFFSYCLLVFWVTLAIAGIIGLIFILRNSVLAAIILFPVQMYLTMVITHLLGRFYYLNQARLNWDV